MHSANISSIQVILMPTMNRNVSFESTTAVQETCCISIIYVIRILSLSERFLFVTKTIQFGLK